MKTMIIAILKAWEWLITPISDVWIKYKLNYVIPHKKVWASNNGQITITTKGRKGKEISRVTEKEGGSIEP